MPILSLRGIALKYNIHKDLVRKTLAENPDFPYTPSPPGRPHEGFKFDTDEVEKWLLTNEWARGATQYHPELSDRLAREAEEKLQKQADAGLVPANLPESVRRIVRIKEEKNKKSDVQTALLQLELDKKRGMLVPRDVVINEFAPMIAGLAKGLEQMPNLIGKRHGLSDEIIRDIRDHLDQLRDNLTRSAKQGILSENYVLVEDDDDA